MGRPKQLLTLGGLTLLDRVLREALLSELDAVILVLGARAQSIREGLATDVRHPKLSVVENTRFRDGLSSSILAGLNRAEATYDYVMIILADMPLITADVINRLLRATLESNQPLGAVKIGGRRSHPVIINRRFYSELHQIRGDKGARDLFLQHAPQVCSVEMGEALQELDIDTPQDYRQFIASPAKHHPEKQ